MMLKLLKTFLEQVHIDAFIVSSLDFVTSLIASAAIFSVLGAMSTDLGIDMKKLASTASGALLI